MKERIKKLRKTLGLTQQEFATHLGISRGSIATYETREGSPGSSVINLICREFNVNEAWLRTGEGEMFVKRTEEDELTQVFSSIAASDDELIKRIIRSYWRLDDKEKAAVKKLIDGFSPDGSSSSFAAPSFSPSHIPSPDMTLEQEVEREVDRYRQQLLSEKERASQA